MPAGNPDDLFRKLNEQEKINDELRKENNSLRKDLEKLKREFEDYKVRHPENVGIKNGKPYFYKPEAKSEQKCDTADSDSATASIPKKRPGARIGHRGYHRPVPDHVDEDRKVSITQCPHCWSNLSDSFTARTRIIEDIPVIRPTIIRYTIERRYCSKCKKPVEPVIREALPKAALSLRTMLVIAYMKTVERLPAARVSELMRDLFGLHVTEGEVMHIVRQLSKHLGPEYRRLVRRVRKARARYMDETTWRTDGRNSYVWVFVTEAESIYVMGSRSHEVPLKVLGKHNGVDMHDGFSAYIALAKITKNPQGWCRSHVMNDAKDLVQYNKTEGNYILSTLRRAYKMAEKLLEKPVESVTESDMQAVYGEFLHIDIPYESKKCSGFVRTRLRRKRDDIFRFVLDRSVDSTNNRAERAIRPIVTYRKVSGGSRSDRGARDFARVYSVLESQRKKGKLPFRTDPG